MHLTNATSFEAGWTLGLRPDGRELVVVVAKATFQWPRSGEEPVLAEQQVPLVTADEFTGEPGFSAPLYEADYAPVKPRCDVLFNGSAYAPERRPAVQLGVGLRVGQMTKSFAVVGKRHWIKGVLGFEASQPQLFVQLPISYDVAFGGRDLSSQDPAMHRYYPLNHAGVGFHVNHDDEVVQGRPLPSTEQIGEPVSDPDGKYEPMALGAFGRAWEPRSRLAGTYDKDWLEEHFPFLPSDFDERYYQAAPSDQQVPWLRGGEEVHLVNLTPEGKTQFRLPTISVPLVFYPASGEKETIETACDTLLLEPDLARFTIVWRGSRLLRRDIFEIDEVVVGEPSRGWKRARDNGKTFYESLSALPRHQDEEDSDEVESGESSADEDDAGELVADDGASPGEEGNQ